MRRRALTLVALLALAACADERADRDAQLKATLAGMREAIRRHRAETGRYPESLRALVPKYLPAVPVDPITGSADTWRVTTEESVQPSADFTPAPATAPPAPVITDVQSGAPAPYSSY